MRKFMIICGVAAGMVLGVGLTGGGAQAMPLAPATVISGGATQAPPLLQKTAYVCRRVRTWRGWRQTCHRTHRYHPRYWRHSWRYRHCYWRHHRRWC